MNSTIRLGYFYRTLPLMAAQRHGFYRRHGVEVQEERVRSSTQQFAYLLDGRYDVVQTSPDNVANYRYIETATDSGLREPVELEAIGLV